MTASETEAYLQSLVDFYDDPDCMAKEPPRPPSFEVAMDVAASCAGAIATILECQSTGRIEPSEKSRLAAADMLDKHARGLGL